MSPGPSGVPDLLSALSSGTVPVVVEPVHTAEQAAELDLMLWRIRGTRGVELRGLQDGGAAFDVALGRPVAMASDLRTLFGRDLVSCRREGGVFRVRLARPPATREEHVALDVSLPVTGRWAAPPTGDEPEDTPVGTDPAETAAPHGPGGTSLAHLDPRAGAARLGEPAVLAAALDADPTTLVLLVDHGFVVRGIHGGLRLPWAPPDALVPGAALSDVAPPHQHRGLADRVAAVLRGARTTDVYTKGGGGRVFEIALRAVELDGRVAGCRATVRDVTDEHQDRERLRDLTGVFEIAFSDAPTGQALMTPEGTWLRVNDALRRTVHPVDADLDGSTLGDLLGAGDARRERQLRDEAVRGERTRYAVDLDPRAAGLATTGVRAQVVAVASAGGRVRAFVVHFAPTEELPVALDPEIVDGPW